VVSFWRSETETPNRTRYHEPQNPQPFDPRPSGRPVLHGPGNDRSVRVNRLERIGQPTMKKIHQYHSTKIFRVRLDESAIIGIILIGTFFVLGMFFSH
jgi:hypothetical protein